MIQNPDDLPRLEAASAEFLVSVDKYLPPQAIAAMRRQLVEVYAHIPDFESRLVIKNGKEPLMQVIRK